jgi:hypothetical protein
MLLNIDKPLRCSTLHDETCSHVPKPHGTRFKPLGTLGRDGGWFSVSSVSQAKKVAAREFPSGTFKPCPYCQGS